MSIFAPQTRWITVGLVALITMFAFEGMAVSLAMPTVARDLDGEALYPIAVMGLLTASVVGMVTGGIWSDARGPRIALLVGGLVFTAGLVLSGVASTMVIFVIGRLVQGLGCGIALTSAYVTVADAFAPPLRPRVFALFAAAWVLPAVIGPFVAGAIVDVGGWRPVFTGVAAIAFVCTVGTTISVRAQVARRHQPIRWGQLPLLALLASSGALALHGAGQLPGIWPVPVFIGGFVLCLWASARLLPRGTFTGGPGLPSVIMSRVAISSVFACVELFVPKLLQDESGLSPTGSGMVMMLGAIGWSSGAAFSGRRARASSYSLFIGVGSGLLLLASACAVALVAIQDQRWPATVVACLAVLLAGLGMGIAVPLQSTLSLDLAEPGKVGASGSALQMGDALGQSVVAGIVGAVFARWLLWDPGSSYLSAFGLAVLSALLGLWAARRIRPASA